MVTTIEQPIDSPFLEIKIADNIQGNIRTPANIILVSEGRFTVPHTKETLSKLPPSLINYYHKLNHSVFGVYELRQTASW